jgi:hypothetical protein
MVLYTRVWKSRSPPSFPPFLSRERPCTHILLSKGKDVLDRDTYKRVEAHLKERGQFTTFPGVVEHQAFYFLVCRKNTQLEMRIFFPERELQIFLNEEKKEFPQNNLINIFMKS